MNDGMTVVGLGQVTAKPMWGHWTQGGLLIDGERDTVVVKGTAQQFYELAAVAAALASQIEHRTEEAHRNIDRLDVILTDYRKKVGR